jgi:hypothetical protein
MPVAERILTGIALCVALLAGTSAQATVTVTPVSNYSASSSGVALSNTSGNGFYYPNSSGLTQTAQLFLDTSDVSVPGLVDLTKTQAEVSPYPNMLLFNVYSSKAFTGVSGPSGSYLAVSVSTGSTDLPEQPVNAEGRPRSSSSASHAGLQDGLFMRRFSHIPARTSIPSEGEESGRLDPTYAVSGVADLQPARAFLACILGGRPEKPEFHAGFEL